MKMFNAILLVWILSVTASAQTAPKGLMISLGADTPTCTEALAQAPYNGVPARFHKQAFSDPATMGQGKVYIDVPVPPGEAWLVDAASTYLPAGVNPTLGAEFMIEILEPLPEQNGYPDCGGDDAAVNAHCWSIGIYHAPGTPQATPVGPDPNIRQVLMPGERLRGRTNGSMPFGIMVRYWIWPAVCGPFLAAQ